MGISTWYQISILALARYGMVMRGNLPIKGTVLQNLVKFLFCDTSHRITKTRLSYCECPSGTQLNVVKAICEPCQTGRKGSMCQFCDFFGYGDSVIVR